jgi:hypothetical protein
VPDDFVGTVSDAMSLAPAELIAACGAPRTRQQDIVNGLEPDSEAAIERAVRYLEHHAPKAIQGEGGNSTTYNVACELKDFGITEDTCIDLLIEHWNEEKADPPWDVEELSLIVENTYHYGKDPIGIKDPKTQFERVELEESEAEVADETKAPKYPRALPFWTYDPNEIPAPKGWLIKDVAARGETAGWIGPPGTGKSSLVLDWFAHCATGRDWRGYKCKQQAAFVYFAFERAQLTRRRIKAYADKWELPGIPVAVVGRMLNLLDTQNTLPAIHDTIKAVEDQYGMPVGGIALDTFPKGIAAGGGDENSARDVNMAAANLRRLHELVPVHIAVIGHTGKDESRGARGSNANQGDWDVEFRVTEGEGKINTVKIEKANDQDSGHVTHFRMQPRKIGVGEDQENIMTSIVSEDIPVVREKTAEEERVSDKHALALRALHACLETGVAPPEGIPAPGLVCRLDDWRDELLRRGVLERDPKGHYRKAYQRMREALARKNRIEECDGFVWLRTA